MKKKYLHIAIIIIGIIFISLGAFHTNLWFDESYSVGLANHNFGEICNITSYDVHPPLYYYFLRILNLIFGNNIILYRLLSIVPVAILAVLGFTHIRKDFGEETGLIFSFLVLFLPGLTRYAIEIRMYSWAMLFIGITAIYAYRLYKEFNIKNLIIFGIFSLASAYTHYYALMATGLINLILFAYLFNNLKDKKNEFISFCICAVVQIILYLPWLIIFVNQLAGISGGFWIPAYTFPGTFIRILSVPVSGDNLNETVYFILMLILYVYAFSIIYKEKKANNEVIIPSFGIMFYWFIVFLVLVVSLIMTPLLIDRYMLVVMAPLIFSFSILFSKEKRKYITIGICLVILALSIINNVKLVQRNYSSSNKEMIEFVEDNLKKEDTFLIYSNSIGGFSVTAKYLDHKTYFHDKDDWGVSETYKSFGPNIVVEQNLDKIMEELDGRIWIVNMPEEAFREEIINKYDVELLERKEFNTAYENLYFSFTIVEK